MSDELGDFTDGPDAVHIDRVTVAFRAVEHPSDTAVRDAVVFISDGGSRIDRERLRRQVERLHWDYSDPKHPTHVPFVSEERLNNVSWGAASAVLALIVSAAFSGVIGNAVYDGLKAVGKRIHGARGSHPTDTYLDAGHAERQAVLMARAAWSELSHADLMVVSCRVDGGTATVTLRAPDGSTIVAEPSRTDGGILGPITRGYT